MAIFHHTFLRRPGFNTFVGQRSGRYANAVPFQKLPRQGQWQRLKPEGRAGSRYRDSPLFQRTVSFRDGETRDSLHWTRKTGLISGASMLLIGPQGPQSSSLAIRVTGPERVFNHWCVEHLALD